MAISLSIKRPDAPATTTEIWDGTFKRQTWDTRPAGNRVIETFDLVAKGTDNAIITAANQLMDQLYDLGAYHRDKLRRESVWLQSTSDAETPTARRSLLYKADFIPLSRENVTPLLDGNGVAFYRLIVERNIAWEETEILAASTGPVNCLGGMWTLVDEGGNLDGRINEIDLVGKNGAGGPLDKLWVGLRPVYKSTTNFNPKWECESGDNSTDATDTADAGDSGGSKVRVSFATVATMAERVIMTTQTFVTEPEDQIGRYLILLRGSVTSGTCAVQMRTGFTNATKFSPHKTVYISNTTDQLIELGEISIPPFAYKGSAGAFDVNVVANFQIRLWAERISGSGSLDLDCLVFIPTEHFSFVSGAALIYSATPTGRRVRIMTHEDESNAALELLDDDPVTSLEFAHSNWFYPNGGGVLVLAGERSGSQVVADAVDIFRKITPRWLNYTNPA